MKRLFFLIVALIIVGVTAQAQIVKGTGIIYFDSLFNVAPTLPSGSELAFSIKMKKFARWDRNLSQWVEIAVTQEQIEDYVGAMATGGTQSGITVTYNDATGTLDFEVGTTAGDITLDTAGMDIITQPNVQDALEQVDSVIAAGVTHDATLTGTGRPGSALSVVDNYLNQFVVAGTSGTITVNADGETVNFVGAAGSGISTAASGQNMSFSFDYTSNTALAAAISARPTGSGTTNYFPVFTGSTAIGNSIMRQISSQVGIGVDPSQVLDVNGPMRLRSVATPSNLGGNLFYDGWFAGQNGTNTSYFAKAVNASFTNTYIPFSNSSGQLQENISLQYTLSTADRLLVGQNTDPSGVSIIYEAGSGVGGLNIRRANDAGSTAPYIRLQSAATTYTSYFPTQTDYAQTNTSYTITGSDALYLTQTSATAGSPGGVNVTSTYSSTQAVSTKYAVNINQQYLGAMRQSVAQYSTGAIGINLSQTLDQPVGVEQDSMAAYGLVVNQIHTDWPAYNGDYTYLTSLRKGGNRMFDVRHDGWTAIGMNTTNNSLAVPTRMLDVNGEVRIRDLVTTTSSLLTGADANGVLSSISVGSGLTLSGNVLSSTGGTVTGTGTSGQLAYWTGTSSQAGATVGSGLSFSGGILSSTATWLKTELEAGNDVNISGSGDLTYSGDGIFGWAKADFSSQLAFNPVDGSFAMGWMGVNTLGKGLIWSKKGTGGEPSFMSIRMGLGGSSSYGITIDSVRTLIDGPLRFGSYPGAITGTLSKLIGVESDGDVLPVDPTSVGLYAGSGQVPDVADVFAKLRSTRTFALGYSTKSGFENYMNTGTAGDYFSGFYHSPSYWGDMGMLDAAVDSARLTYSAIYRGKYVAHYTSYGNGGNRYRASILLSSDPTSVSTRGKISFSGVVSGSTWSYIFPGSNPSTTSGTKNVMLWTGNGTGTDVSFWDPTTAYTFGNGLTNSSGTITLGGSLTSNSTITATTSATLTVNTSTAGIHPFNASATTGRAVNASVSGSSGTALYGSGGSSGFGLRAFNSNTGLTASAYIENTSTGQALQVRSAGTTASTVDVKGVGTDGVLYVEANEGTSASLPGRFLHRSPAADSTSINTALVVEKILGGTASNTTDVESGVGINYKNENTSGTSLIVGRIAAVYTDVTGSSEDSEFRFYSLLNSTSTYHTTISNTGIRIGGASGPIWIYGSGSPEGVVAAPVGSFYSRTDGGTGTSWYVKESGTGDTGWTAK